jgi:hypothetical protein
MKSCWSRSAAVLSVMGAVLLAGCGESQTPEQAYNAWEKEIFCGVLDDEEIVQEHMAVSEVSRTYVAQLRRNWERASYATKVSECHGWDDEKRIAQTRAVEVKPGHWQIEGETVQPGRFKKVEGVHVARMDGGDLKVVPGNP